MIESRWIQSGEGPLMVSPAYVAIKAQIQPTGFFRRNVMLPLVLGGENRMRVVSRAVATGLLVALLCSFAHAQPKSASHVELEQLKSQLQNIRQGFPGDMAVYMKNLTTGEEIAVDTDSIYETFSVIKI